VTVGTFTLTVEASTAPTWFEDLPELTWTDIATGSGSGYASGARLDQVCTQDGEVWPTDAADPIGPLITGIPVVGPQSSMRFPPDNYCQNSNGMALDPLTGECFLPANGGHAGYMGNETMRLKLRQSIPAWERFVDSTPPWHITSLRNAQNNFISVEQNASLSYYCYTDGPQHTLPTVDQPTSAVQQRPASCHTACLPTYSEGKVWLPLQNSTDLNGGTSTLSKTAVDVQSVRDDPSLRYWRYGDIAPWEFHGVMDEAGALTQSQFLFPTAALDRSTGRIWICPGTTSGMRHFWMLETRGDNAGLHQTFRNAGTGSVFLQTDNAVCGDITTGVVNTAGAPVKLFVVYGRRQFVRDVYVLNISTIEAAEVTTPLTYTGVLDVNAWAKYVATDATPMKWINSEIAAAQDPAGTKGPQQGWGAFWHQGSQGLLMFNCDHAVDIDRVRNGHLRKLALPINLQGRYDPTNPTLSFKYHDVPVNSSGTVPGTCLATGLVTGGSFTRFNIARNFDGAGNDLVISLNAYNTATSVMKLPSTGV
jgi:hypothetical protein